MSIILDEDCDVPVLDLHPFVVEDGVRQTMAEGIGRVDVIVVIPSISNKEFLTVFSFEINSRPLLFVHVNVVLKFRE
jgi:hypothetical protein